MNERLNKKLIDVSLDLDELRDRMISSQNSTRIYRNVALTSGVIIGAATERGVFSWFYGGRHDARRIYQLTVGTDVRAPIRRDDG